MFQLLAQGSIETRIEEEVDVLNFFQKDIGIFITRLVELAMIGGAIILLIYLIWGAIDWIASEGDKAKYESARNKITHALLGMAILASAWALWSVANYFLGIDKIFTRGGGTTVSTSGAEDCWPFESCEAWQQQFYQEHGYYPPETETSGSWEWQDLRDSQEFLEEWGRSPTQEEWEEKYRTGEWPD